MKLKNLMQDLKKANYVEPKDRLDLFKLEDENNYILIEHIDTFNIENYKIPEFDGVLLKFIIINNKISYIGLEAYHGITRANKDFINYLLELIDLEIEDLDQYKPDKNNLIISV